MESCNHLRGVRRVLAIIGMAIGGVIIAAAMALLFGFIVMWLWNWLMPLIFGLPEITFWQAWGLVVLAHILFKSFPHNQHEKHDDRWKRRFQEKYLEKKEPTDSEPEAPVAE